MSTRRRAVSGAVVAGVVAAVLLAAPPASADEISSISQADLASVGPLTFTMTDSISDHDVCTITGGEPRLHCSGFLDSPSGGDQHGSGTFTGTMSAALQVSNTDGLLTPGTGAGPWMEQVTQQSSTIEARGVPDGLGVGFGTSAAGCGSIAVRSTEQSLAGATPGTLAVTALSAVTRAGTVTDLRLTINDDTFPSGQMRETNTLEHAEHAEEDGCFAGNSYQVGYAGSHAHADYSYGVPSQLKLPPWLGGGLSGWTLDPAGTWTPDTGGVLAQKTIRTTTALDAPDTGTVRDVMTYTVRTSPAHDHVVPRLTWDNQHGGMTLRYRVDATDSLSGDTDIDITFATGPSPAARTGSVLYSLTVPSGTASGSYGPFHVDGNLLVAAPAGVTHLVAATSDTDFGAVPDVRVSYGPHADPQVVSGRMTRIVKDSLRVAGQSTAQITSTARRPHDQARAMFNNLTNPAHPIAQNIATQHQIYGAAGDAVIDVFAHDVAGLTPAQIQADADRIKADMEDEINHQGCSKVTHHCVDPAIMTVIDVTASVFTAANGPLFVHAAHARGVHVIDERSTNGCYHLELTLA